MSVSAMKMRSMNLARPEILEIEAVTLGLSLLDCSGRLPQTVRARSYDKIRRIGGSFVKAATDVADKLGVVSNYHHVSTTPVSLIMDGGSVSDFVALAGILNTAMEDIGVDSISGFAALIDKGMTSGDRALLESLPDALTGASRLYATVVSSSPVRTNSDAEAIVAQVIGVLNENEKTKDCLPRLSVVDCTSTGTLPYYSGYHYVSEGTANIGITIAGSDSIRSALERLGFSPDDHEIDAAIKSAVAKLIRGAELFARQTAERLTHLCGHEISAGKVSLSADSKLRDSELWTRAGAVLQGMRSVSVVPKLEL